MNKLIEDGLLRALDYAKKYRTLGERRHRETDGPGRDAAEAAFWKHERECKDDPLAWVLLTAISCDELDMLLRYVRADQRAERTRGGMRIRHYIRSRDTYSTKALFLPGRFPDEEDLRGWNAGIVWRKPLKRIVAKIEAALEGGAD